MRSGSYLAWVFGLMCLIGCRSAGAPTEPTEVGPSSTTPAEVESPESVSLEPEAPPEPAPPSSSKTETARAWAEDLESEQRLLERANLVLDKLASRHLVEAAQELDGLREALPGYPPARIVEKLLRARLTLAQAATEPATPTLEDTSAATEKLAQARDRIQEGRDTEAREVLEQALALDPRNAEVAETLFAVLKRIGLECYSKGESAQAVAEWKRALEIRPGDPETLRFLKRADAVNKNL